VIQGFLTGSLPFDFRMAVIGPSSGSKTSSSTGVVSGAFLCRGRGDFGGILGLGAGCFALRPLHIPAHISPPRR
jgi:hypothetical protein